MVFGAAILCKTCSQVSVFHPNIFMSLLPGSALRWIHFVSLRRALRSLFAMRLPAGARSHTHNLFAPGPERFSLELSSAGSTHKSAQGTQESTARPPTGNWNLTQDLSLGLCRFLPATLGCYSLMKSVISVGVDNV